MGYKLKVLSPVHIGCGEQYNGLNFILDNNTIYLIDPDTITKLLGKENIPKFTEWLENNTNIINQLGDKLRKERIQKKDSASGNSLKNELRIKKQNFTLKKFVEESGILNVKEMKKYSLYSVLCHKNFNDYSEFYPFIKQMYKPYIPGTEIKGAIRTAILYCFVLDDEKIQKWLEEELINMLREPIEFRNGMVTATYQDYINDVKNNSKPDQHKKSKLSERIKNIESMFQNKILNSNVEKSDAKYDILKFLQIGDSELFSTDRMFVSYVEPFNISNKFKTFYEFVRPDTELMLTSLKLEDKKSKDVKIEKMNLSEDKKNIISSIDAIFEKCKRFSDDLLDEEISYYTSKKNDIVKHLKNIKEQNTANSPVLRIGKDEGYLSLTVGLAVKKIKPDLYENVLIHTTKNKSYDSSCGGLFPKSRKIVNWNDEELTAGWIQLISYASDTKKSVIKNDIQSNSSPDISSLYALQAKFGRGKR